MNLNSMYEQHKTIKSNNNSLGQIAEIIKPTYFDYLLETSSETKQLKIAFQINSEMDMYNAVQRIEDELPAKIIFNSTKYSQLDIKKIYREIVKSFTDCSILINFNTLANYKEQMIFKRFLLVDNAHKSKSARAVMDALDGFTNVFAESIKDTDFEQVILNLYHYIFTNIKYNASSFQEMIIGNLGSGKLACNGISRLVFETLNKLGIQTEIRKGLSHYWNIISFENKEITFDVTSDLLLNKKFLTLGNSSRQHLQNTSMINLYNVAFESSAYNVIKEYEFKISSENRVPIFY